MVKNHRRIKLYAVGVSVLVHIAALTVFAAIKISQSAPVPLQTTTTVSISQAARLAERQAAMPKPKVNPVESKPFDVSGSIKSEIIKGKPIAKADAKAGQANILPGFEMQKGNSQRQAEDLRPPIPEETTNTTVSQESAASIEFFDSPANGRRICYVVDCSGSMRGLWNKVREELDDSISKLPQDYYFCVIVFGGGSILETGGGKMVRATEQAKKEAYGVIAAIQPRGGTNAADALERAIMVKDRTGAGASSIYFLTDGFELSEQDGTRFAHKVATVHRSFAPKAQINTIGFWCTEQDGKVLEAIAKESGGKFVMIGSPGEQKDGDN